MRMLCLVLAKVTVYDDMRGTFEKHVHVLYAENMTDAMQSLEDYYGDSIEKVHLTIYEEGLVTFPTNMYKQLDDFLAGRVDF